MKDSFKTRQTLAVGGQSHEIFSLPAIKGHDLGRLPFSLKILLENLLRFEDGVNVTRDDIEALLKWDAKAAPSHEIAFTPARVIMQDFTGVPVVVDLAAMREAMTRLGGNPDEINPLAPAELVIDHSVQVDEYGTADSLRKNNAIEFARNGERYSFLRWGQTAFSNFKVVPPNTGIVHQVNLEHLARVVFAEDKGGVRRAYPDTLVGTDSHTTMVNGLGVLGWGVGGIEAEAAMLGQPITMLIPQVIGFRLKGALPAGATATDLVLTVTEMLRKKGVVDKFVEFFGDGLAALPLADRATIANMAPEFGSTCGIFPIDEETIRYLELTGRTAEQIALVEAYARAQGMWRTNGMREADYTDVLELDLATVEPSLAGPKRPQDRVPLRVSKDTYRKHLAKMAEERAQKNPTATGKATGRRRRQVLRGGRRRRADRGHHELHEHLQPGGAHRRGIARPQRASTRPQRQALGEDQPRARLARRDRLPAEGRRTRRPRSRRLLRRGLRLHDLHRQLRAPEAGDIRRREGGRRRRDLGAVGQPQLRGSRPRRGEDELPRLPAAGRGVCARRHDGHRPERGAARHGYRRQARLPQGHLAVGPGNPADHRHLGHLGHVQEGLRERVRGRRELEQHQGSASQGLPVGFHVDLRAQPAVLRGHDHDPAAVADIRGARVLAVLGDSVTTDHISPAGNISKTSPAAKYLMAQGVQPVDFNSYGARRGNHEVMMRGTFANIRLRNLLAPGTEGGVSVHIPTGEQMSIYDAAMKYKSEGTPLVVIAGKEYGTGSSRDWAAKGTMLLGVRAVIAESFERIHRSNLIGMGVLPLQFKDGEHAQGLGLTGKETYEIIGLNGGAARMVTVVATPASGTPVKFEVRVRIDTPKEREYYQHGGILQYVVRQLAGSGKAA